MHYSVRVAVIDSFDDLVDEALDKVRREFLFDLSEIFLKVVLHVFKN